MKKYSYLFFFLFSFSFLSFNNHQDHVKVNLESSTIKWIGSKISESHEGNIDLSSGKLVFDHGRLVGGEFVIDMNTIKTTDIESEKYRKKLDDHLKDEDFFNVSEYPKSFLKFTKVKKIEDSYYEIVADLTIKGITHAISFGAEVKIKGTHFLGTANIKIDRTKWGIEYKSASFFEYLGDKAILDEIILDVFLLSEK